MKTVIRSRDSDYRYSGRMRLGGVQIVPASLTSTPHHAVAWAPFHESAAAAAAGQSRQLDHRAGFHPSRSIKGARWKQT